MAEITYCDDYDDLARQGAVPPRPEPKPVVETKVIAAPQAPEVAPATVAETA